MVVLLHLLITNILMLRLIVILLLLACISCNTKEEIIIKDYILTEKDLVPE